MVYKGDPRDEAPLKQWLPRGESDPVESRADCARHVVAANILGSGVCLCHFSGWLSGRPKNGNICLSGECLRKVTKKSPRKKLHQRVL